MTPSNLSMATLGLSLSLALGLAGCGNGGGTGSTGRAGSTETTGSTELVIEVRAVPGGDPRTYTVRCDPPGGAHPDPEAACRTLAQVDVPFATVPPGTACTQVYGGPQTATVTGSWRGEPVRARFARTNGCQAGRWDTYAVLLGEKDGAGDR